MTREEAKKIGVGDCIFKRNKYSFEVMYIKKVCPDGKLWVVDYAEISNEGLGMNHGYDVNFEYSSSNRWVKRDVSNEFLRWWAIQKMTDVSQKPLALKMMKK